MMKEIENPTQHIVRPGETISLTDISTRAKPHYTQERDEAEDEFKALRKELADLQFKLYAEDKRKVLVVLQALDAGGNVLATREVRIRPKSIDAGGTGSFSVRFDSIDPSWVVRTRATVVKWQSEVLGAS